jgi:cyclic pyranopterin phosphate synthase
LRTDRDRDAAPRTGPLLDSFGRVHSSLRISVTDRCNIRCFYCMPAENVRFKPREEILSFEEIERFVRAVVPLGIDRLRLTGGEPLVRAQLPRLVRRLAAIPGVRDLALTTNGLLLAEQAAALAQAGLHRLNVSLDALSEANFERIARRKGLERVLGGLAEAQRVGFQRIRLNAVAIRGITESEAVPLARFARQHGLELRFIEFMPLDADGQWETSQVLDGETLRELLHRQVAPLKPVVRPDPSQPATDYEYTDGGGRVGFINPVSVPFCQDCNRLRLTADGHLRNCLFSTAEWDARGVLRGGGDDGALRRLVRECIWRKKPSHGIDSAGFERPERAMYQIGG